MLFSIPALLITLVAAVPLEKRATVTSTSVRAATTTVTSIVPAVVPVKTSTTVTSVAPRVTTIVTSVPAHVVTSTRTSTIVSTTRGATSTIVRSTTVTTTLPGSVVTRTVTIPASTVTARVTTSTGSRAQAATTTTAAAPTSANLYPRLIVPVIPGTGAQGVSYLVTLSSTEKTDLLYDIPASSGYKTCTLTGRFPVGGNPTSSGAYGSAQVQAELLASNIATSTSSSTQPAGKTDLGTRAAGTALNGANAVYSSFSVTAGTSVSIALTAVSGSLRVFEDYNTPVTGYTLNCV